MGEELEQEKTDEPEIIRIGEQVLNPIWFDDDSRWRTYDGEVIPFPLHSVNSIIDIKMDGLDFTGAKSVVRYAITRTIKENPALREANGFEVDDITRYTDGEEIRNGRDFVTTSERFIIKFHLYKYIPATPKNKWKVFYETFGITKF